MSYYASGGGEMILNKKGRKNLDAVQNVLDNTADEAFNYTKIDNNGQSLYVSRDFENYHEEKVFAFLQEINPYIKNGESIEYRGEDGQTWRFIKHNGNFFEQSGEIRYSKKHESQRTKSEELKPKTVYVVQGNYGYGWDDLTYCNTKAEAEADKKDYDNNENVPHRIRTRLEEVK